MPLVVKPLTLAQANEAIERLHRHHNPVIGHRFSIGAYSGRSLVGVAVIGRSVARAVDQNSIAEVTRVATDGHMNACSFLYAAATRICREMGFDELRTYILESEPGTSLKALKGLGWVCDGIVRKDGAGWNSRSGRTTNQPTCAKVRWRVVFRKKRPMRVPRTERFAWAPHELDKMS